MNNKEKIKNCFLLPDIEVFVGDLVQLPGLTAAAAAVTRTYPAVQDWPVIHDPPERLFPAVTGYYPSFSKYWQQVSTQYAVR